ncbi:protein kinase [Fusobacterium necrophorum]|uniref:Protein kinase n=1 Tax=Fusobacterium necrophorum subsp. funduliforme TaxID=143387 RepID=A0A162IYD3_9FUSO|nr:protein kinase [Fusobacterium necrophorum]KYL04697.1 protein kinase [Fusobacterium necrophorum subsp. funduliforme]
MEKRFKKESKIYLLKNKDIPVLRFENEKKIDNTKLGDYPSYRFRHIQILYEDLLPKGYANTTDSSELKHWIEQRKIPKNRKNMEDILHYQLQNQITDPNNPMSYIDVSYGLSLNDSYWIVPEDGKEYLWEDYNLYQNKFSEILSLVAFGEKNISNFSEENRTSPEYTTDGMLAKCWTTIDDTIVLLKKSSEHHKVEAYAEYYMAQIAKMMNFAHISYDIIKYHDSIVSSCSLFTSEEEGFVPMYRCLTKDDCHKKGARLLESISEITGQEFLEDLMVFDSLIYNTDRHLGNLGMMIENTTGKYLRPAPIFDNGNSILSFLPGQNLPQIFKNYTSKFEIDFDLLSANLVSERHREGLKKLETFQFQRHPLYNLPEDILVKGEKFIQARAKLLTRQLDKKKERERNPWSKKIEKDRGLER